VSRNIDAERIQNSIKASNWDSKILSFLFTIQSLFIVNMTKEMIGVNVSSPQHESFVLR